ncbi:solute carrier family 12 member 5 [Platysternon megacephalum]|uniref:Solute carrier family 12 member 5 n=1 Tax=Platysternon megacephalum TaxID=55544 RepID=A0A4D9E5F4_9SAUR|nr:solute carrier family 12 member 5 [Platysternon megacephalum]
MRLLPGTSAPCQARSLHAQTPAGKEHTVSSAQRVIQGTGAARSVSLRRRCTERWWRVSHHCDRSETWSRLHDAVSEAQEGQGMRGCGWKWETLSRTLLTHVNVHVYNFSQVVGPLQAQRFQARGYKDVLQPSSFALRVLRPGSQGHGFEKTPQIH